MNTTITKPKLPKTQTYPIKTSFLEAIIISSKFDQSKFEFIQYLPTQRTDHLFEAHYIGKRRKEFAAPGTIYITIYAVNAKDSNQISTVLKSALEQNFPNWLNKLEENKFDWSDESHGFHVWYKDNVIKIAQ
jgi:hypothetical protein